MPERKYEAVSGSGYRYSINGQEKEKELNENITTALYWEYDSRIGRRWNMDPKPNIAVSPYNCFAGNPIWMTDILGDTTINGQKMEGRNAESATFLETVTIKASYNVKPIAPVVESTYDNDRSVQNAEMAKDIVTTIWNNSEIGKKIMSKIPSGLPDGTDLARLLSNKFTPGLYQAGEAIIKNRDMPIDMAAEGIGIVNPYIALFNRTILASMLNDRIRDNNLVIFETIDRSWRNLNQLNAAISGACNSDACLIKKDYLGVLTVTQKQFESIMIEKFVIPSELKSELVYDFNVDFLTQRVFNGEKPKYYLFYNKLADKGFLHINEIGIAPIIIPKKYQP